MFVIPFLAHLFVSKDVATDRALLSIGLVGWIFMYSIEVIAMRVEGLRTYITDPWNITDQLSIVYPIYFFKVIANPGNALANMHHAKAYKDGNVDTTEESKVLVILSGLIFLYIMIKITYFFKLNDSMGLMSTLLIGVFKGVVPFLIIFLTFVVCFSMMSAILGGN